MRVMHPRYAVEKEYLVVIAGRPTAAALQRLQRGMTARDEQFLPARVRVLDQTTSETRLSMVLREGRKREVRRMWQALGHKVLDLQRIRIDGVQVGNLPEGATRPLTTDEIAALKSAVS
jgi:23S rRNA pseudouridine2605 synthase